MSANGDPVTILAISECWDLLSSVPPGRLVTSVDGRPEIFRLAFQPASSRRRLQHPDGQWHAAQHPGFVERADRCVVVDSVNVADRLVNRKDVARLAAERHAPQGSSALM